MMSSVQIKRVVIKMKRKWEHKRERIFFNKENGDWEKYEKNWESAEIQPFLAGIVPL